jgi:hypothetical protein
MKITINRELEDWITFEGDKESLTALGLFLLDAADGQILGTDDQVIQLGSGFKEQGSFGFECRLLEL